ncbi:hypothetical protein VP501E541_P0089 [Vibrio phage 501E54-1]|nr:hypothetical protein VP501E541_P0089 [Vibrio phage 501E54-1]
MENDWLSCDRRYSLNFYGNIEMQVMLLIRM